MKLLETLRRISKLGFYLGAGATMTLVQACGGATQRDADVDVDQAPDVDVDQAPDADQVRDADPDQRSDADEDDDWDMPCE
jgi:hypothetical protein